ncbi:OmpA family protein [Chitinophaga sp. GCM10012297]|uniref:OmpA family protein n=1 Tax=Chitinophaga chungangae TaxID=2821488 RepID=A0ABS3YGP9_9BACT|nr:OmpA family protein [Chitinophaga chungangae]MBO9153847.1 OmpA family protein [Chitinophaga chungangae]
MAFDLIDTLKNLFNNEFSNKAAAQLGENESSVQKAIGGIIPAVLTGLLNKAGSGDTGGLIALIKDATSVNLSQPGNLSSGLPAGLLAKGADILRSLFGNKAGDLTGAIASYAGIKVQSAETLLQTAAPASLSVIGQQAAAQHAGPSGIMDILNSQKDKILAAVPTGLGLASLLGVPSLGDIGNRLSGITDSLKHAVNSVGGTVSTPGSNRWITWLIVAVAIILLIIWLAKGCGGGHNTPVADSLTVTGMEDSAVSAVSTEPVATREPIKVTLPNGAVLEAYKGGIEDRLVAFLQDPNTQGGKDQWFDFDNLNFKTGSAEITPESRVQISNLAAILNAFPKAKIKIGGYTDATGDAKANQQLSQERAEAVNHALGEANVKPVQLLGAEGYGAQFAKAAADAPDEERQKDRRISVSVREK